MLIRPEISTDYDATLAVSAKQCASVEEQACGVSEGSHRKVIVSLVAVVHEHVVRYILFSPVAIATPEGAIDAVGLGPLGVLPQFQRQGIGSALVRHGLEALREKNYTAVVVLGHPDFYPHFGFVPSVAYGIKSQYEVPDDVFMVVELIPRFMSEQDALLQGIFSAVGDELESGKIGGDLLIDSLKTTLAIHLLRHYCTTQPKLSSDTHGLSSSMLKQVTEYIHEHLNQEMKLIELAAIAQISPYHFLRLFKQKVGVTPHQYILQQRIEQAKHLLQQSQLSIADIAIRVGFCDQSHLTRCFKRIAEITPKQLLHTRFASSNAPRLAPSNASRSQ